MQCQFEAGGWLYGHFQLDMEHNLITNSHEEQSGSCTVVLLIKQSSDTKTYEYCTTGYIAL